MASPLIHSFNPANMASEGLEALLVQPESIVARLVELATGSSPAGAQRHAVLVGPWGTGKTHILAVLYHRLRATAEATIAPLRLAWSSAGARNAADFHEWLLSILEAMDERSGDDLGETNAQVALERVTGNTRTVVLVEDIDQWFPAWDAENQQRFGAFLSEAPHVTLHATTRTWPKSLQDRLGALFQVIDLKELNADAAMGLLGRIAALTGDEGLCAFVKVPDAQASVSAIHHIAGGAHRFYVVLSQYLTTAYVDDPAPAVIRALDDLAPYFQAYADGTSRQQRKLLTYLCNQRRPVPVKLIARHNRLTHQCASSQLKALRDISYVHSIPIGRESYYETHLPLVRLGIAEGVRHEQRLSRALRFFQLWFAQKEPREDLPLPEPYGALRRDFLLGPLVLVRKSIETPELAALIRDFISFAVKDDVVHALERAEELVSRRGRPWDLFAKVHCLFSQSRWNEILDQVEQLLQQGSNNPLAWSTKGVVLANMGQYEAALAMFDKAVTLGVKNFDQIWACRGAVQVKLGRHEAALESCRKAAAADPHDPVPWDIRALALGHLGRHKDMLAAAEKAAEVDAAYASARCLRGVALYRLSRDMEALQAFDEAIQLEPNDSLAWAYRGALLLNFDQLPEAADSFRRAVALGVHTPFVLFSRARCLTALDRWSEGCLVLREALDRPGWGRGVIAGGAAVVLKELFTCPAEPDNWPACIAELTALCDRYHATDALCVGLVASVAAMRSRRGSDSLCRTWRDVWFGVAGDRPGFNLALRLLDAAVRYRETRSVRDLLGLAREERAIVIEVMGPPVSRHGPTAPSAAPANTESVPGAT